MELEALRSYLLSAPRNELDVVRYIEENLGFLLSDRGFSRFLYSTRTKEEKADAVLAFLQTLASLEENRPRKKGTVINAYEEYRKYSEPDLRLSQAGFSEAFSGFFCVPLLNEVLDCDSKVVTAVRSLLKTGDSPETIVEYLKTIYDSPASSFIPASDLSSDPKSDSDIIRKKAYALAKSLLMPITVKILDALCMTLTDFTYNDILLENNAVWNLFASTVNNSKAIEQPLMIIEPTPFLLKWIRAHNPFRDRNIVFVLENRTLVEIYSKIFERNGFRFVVSEDLEDYVTSESNIPTDVLLFGTHIKDPMRKTNYINVLVNSSRDEYSLFLLDSDKAVKCGDSPFGRQLARTCFDRIWLLPGGIRNASAPIRKTLLQARFGYCKGPAYVSISHFVLAGNDKNQYLKPYMFQASLPAEKAKESEVSFRNTFWTQYFPFYTKTSQKRKAAIGFCYSAEITVYYRMSGEGTPEKPFRLSAYVREPGGKASTSPMIAESKKFSRKAIPDGVERWIKKDYLLDPKVRAAVSGVYRSYYDKKPITLRGLIYLNPQWSDEYQSDLQEDLFALADSILGEQYLDKITPADIEIAMNEDGQRYSFKMRLLSGLFDFAIQKGHCFLNPAKGMLNQTRIAHEELYQVRANLKRRNFSKEQFCKTYLFLRRHCVKHSQMHLAAMICLLLGLDASIVCALTWGDLIQITEPGFSFLQLCIQRQFDNDGSKVKAFTRREQFRLIPCPTVLASFLLDYYNVALDENAGMPEDYVNAKLIFPDSAGGVKPLFSPKELSKEIKKIIQRSGFPSEIISVPDKKRGTLETDLAYLGELFRSNFDFYARHLGMFESGEIEYFLGVQASTTFSRNYCDYSNVYAQYILFKKLERINSALFYKNGFTAERIKEERIKGSLSYTSMPDMQNRTSVGIHLTLPLDTGADIVVDTKHGTRIIIQDLEVKE